MYQYNEQDYRQLTMRLSVFQQQLERHERGELNDSDLLTYLHGIVQVYNQFGRRDNQYKARIKILLKDRGLEYFKALVEEAYRNLRPHNCRP